MLPEETDRGGCCPVVAERGRRKRSTPRPPAAHTQRRARCALPRAQQLRTRKMAAAAAGPLHHLCSALTHTASFHERHLTVADFSTSFESLLPFL